MGVIDEEGWPVTALSLARQVTDCKGMSGFTHRHPNTTRGSHRGGMCLPRLKGFGSFLPSSTKQTKNGNIGKDTYCVWMCYVFTVAMCKSSLGGDAVLQCHRCQRKLVRSKTFVSLLLEGVFQVHGVVTNPDKWTKRSALWLCSARRLKP